MATSGTYSFDMTCIDMIKSSMRMGAIIGSGETPTDAEYVDARNTLNMMLKAWQNKDIGFWLAQRLTLFLEKDERSYSLGPSGDKATASFVNTTVYTDASEGATSVIVEDATGITTGDNIGIVLDDGTLQWFTGTVSLTTISLSDAIGAGLNDAAASGNVIFTYTTGIQRPNDVIEMRVKDLDNYEYIMEPVSRDEYARIVSKSSSGQPQLYFYDPQLTNSKLWVWPTPNDVNYIIEMTARTVVQDMTAPGHNFQFPSNWLEAIKYNLALRLCQDFSRPIPPDVGAMAGITLQEAQNHDTEDTPVIIEYEDWE